MKVMLSTLAALIALTWSTQAALYKVDPAHTRIGFKVSHLVISKVHGEFTEYDATLMLDDGGELASASAAIQVSSIDTGIEDRDTHLKSADFFDAANHPTITFESTGIEVKEGSKVLTGQLTMRGVSKEIVLPYDLRGPVVDPWGNTKVGFSAKAVIDRTEWGLTWSKALETGGLVVGNAVELELDMEFNKTAKSEAGMVQENKEDETPQ